MHWQRAGFALNTDLDASLVILTSESPSMKPLLLLTLFFFAACTSSIKPAFKGTAADAEIQKARALLGLNAANFLPGPASELPPLLKNPKEISAALRKGGYIIDMRHGRTRYEQITFERDHREKGTFDLDKCETQRSLFSGASHRARRVATP